MNPSFAYFPNRLLATLSLSALLLALGACATLPPPTGELAAAEQAVMRAGDADADQYAPEIVETARAELSRAQAAMVGGDYGQARNLALADMVVETPVEGDITRYTGIYLCRPTVGLTGPVRSGPRPSSGRCSSISKTPAC